MVTNDLEMGLSVLPDIDQKHQIKKDVKFSKDSDPQPFGLTSMQLTI